MIEHEVKVLASKETFDRSRYILDEMLIPSRTIQLNHYYDTRDFTLNSMGNTLRIRQLGNQCILQFKHDKSFDGFEKSCREYEKVVTGLMSVIPSKILPLDLSMLSSTHVNFEYIGCLTTERVDYELDEMIISLDKNLYLGKCDYEVEIEFLERKKAEKMLIQMNINMHELSSIGKYSRFVSEYQRVYSVGTV